MCATKRRALAMRAGTRSSPKDHNVRTGKTVTSVITFEVVAAAVVGEVARVATQDQNVGDPRGKSEITTSHSSWSGGRQ